VDAYSWAPCMYLHMRHDKPFLHLTDKTDI
jgi:hypothetical protein